MAPGPSTRAFRPPPAAVALCHVEGDEPAPDGFVGGVRRSRMDRHPGAGEATGARTLRLYFAP